MLPNASGDAPHHEEPRASNWENSDDARIWQRSHQKWQTFKDMRTEGLFFDVVLKSTDGTAFPAHRIILCACSPYFKSLFSGRWESGNKREISIPGITTSVMNSIFQFAYMREVTLTTLKETKELLIVANHLAIEEVVQKCISYLLEKINFANCVDIWDFARTYYCQNLEKSAKEYILKHITEVVCELPKDEFYNIWNLSLNDLQAFLEDDELNVPEESSIFWIIMRWVDKDILQRHQYLYQLLQCMRWGNLDVDFLEDVIQKHDFIGSCKNSLWFVETLKNLCHNRKLLSSSFPISTKRDVNGNYLISPEHANKWLTPRFPRKLLIVVGGWCGNSPTNSAEMYEPRRKKWRLIKKVFPALLKRPRAYHAILYLGGYLYLIGGYDGQSTYNSCDRYDLANCQWKEMCGMHSRRCYVSATSMGDCIFALGGADGIGDARLKSAEKFFPSRNIWVRLPDMLERRSDAGACCLGSRVYVAGGFTGQECVFTVEFLESKVNQWCRISRMTVPRSGVSVVAYRGKVVVLGGYDGRERLRSVEVFDPEQNDWSMMRPMLTMRSNFTSCVIEGKLVVMGGFNGKSTCSDVEYYDDVCERCGVTSCSGFHLNSSPCSVNQMRMSPGESNEGIEANKDVPSTSRRIVEFTVDLNAVEGSSISSHSESPSRLNLISPQKSPDTTSGPTGGKWKSLPNMLLSRSALSSCVITGLSPKFLNSVLSEEKTKL